jgi:hypothetical protein
MVDILRGESGILDLVGTRVERSKRILFAEALFLNGCKLSLIDLRGFVALDMNIGC